LREGGVTIYALALDCPDRAGTERRMMLGIRDRVG
jgi:hypothetical protein